MYMLYEIQPNGPACRLATQQVAYDQRKSTMVAQIAARLTISFPCWCQDAAIVLLLNGWDAAIVLLLTGWDAAIVLQLTGWDAAIVLLLTGWDATIVLLLTGWDATIVLLLTGWDAAIDLLLTGWDAAIVLLLTGWDAAIVLLLTGWDAAIVLLPTGWDAKLYSIQYTYIGQHRSVKPLLHFHSFGPGLLRFGTVVTPAKFSPGSTLSTMLLRCSYGARGRSAEDLRVRQGYVKKLPRMR